MDRICEAELKSTYDRYILFTFVFLVVIAWYVFLLLFAANYDLSFIEGVGAGSAGGIFLAMLKDAWQFIWRKSSPLEDIDNKRD